MRPPILSKCDCCKVPKPGTEYRRDAAKVRHGMCIECEDTYKALKKRYMSPAQTKKAEYNKAYYAQHCSTHRHKKASHQPTIVQTRWAGGSYPGAQA